VRYSGPSRHTTDCHHSIIRLRWLTLAQLFKRLNATRSIGLRPVPVHAIRCHLTQLHAPCLFFCHHRYLASGKRLKQVQSSSIIASGCDVLIIFSSQDFNHVPLDIPWTRVTKLYSEFPSLAEQFGSSDHKHEFAGIPA
jgi:hypothetical protein